MGDLGIFLAIMWLAISISLTGSGIEKAIRESKKQS